MNAYLAEIVSHFMLAAKRQISEELGEDGVTPLLVPSFSSKGFKSVKKDIETASEWIDGPTLVSCYDTHYVKAFPDITFPSLIFLDSGGYEASRDEDLSDYGEREHFPQPWSAEMHAAQLNKWNSIIPTVAISYDHPKERVNFSAQISRALDMNLPEGIAFREILLKPETESSGLVHFNDLQPHIASLSPFDIIGITEKELGHSLLDRMKNIARIRLALDKEGLQTPIHVFGSLDPISSPLYFLSGADIFDGLTWLRFAYVNGRAIYRQNYGALELGIGAKTNKTDAMCWSSNLHKLRTLQVQMRTFASNHDFSVFSDHEEFFRRSYDTVSAEVGDKNGR